MSVLNKLAQDYLESLGVRAPHVEDAAPKTFDTTEQLPDGITVTYSQKGTAGPVAQDLRQARAAARRNIAVPRALGAPYNLSNPSISNSDIQEGLWHYVEKQMKTPAEKWDEINFQPLPVPAPEEVVTSSWRIWPTGHEVRVALMIAVFVLLGLAFLVTR